MELPDRIEEMTKEQLMHLGMLVDQLDEAYPTDRTDEERLAKDHHLAILPSGLKLSTATVRSFAILTKEVLGMIALGDLPDFWATGDGLVAYTNGATVLIRDHHDVAAFNAALNDIGVYVAAPTLKGDDADGDGVLREGTPHESATGAPV